MRLALYALLLGACGDDAAGELDAPAANGDAAPPPMGFARAPSRIDVASNAAGGERWTDALATFQAEATPDAYRVDAEAEDCRRLIPVVAFCDPPCLDGVCLAGGACAPWPTTLSTGDLTIRGGGLERTLAPPSYALSELGLAFPPSETVTASAPGAAYPAFELGAIMTAPLDAAPRGVTLVVGEPLAFTWTPVDPAARVRLELIADAGHARIHPSVIECDVADADGTIRVPQALVDAHADRAIWSCGDCFTSLITRYRAARATTSAGDVDLWVGSSVRLYVTPN